MLRLEDLIYHIPRIHEPISMSYSKSNGVRYARVIRYEVLIIKGVVMPLIEF